jgi:CheY-like chemotaxis protein
VALRCLIVDDNTSFLKAATALLEREGLTVVGVASNGIEAVARGEELSPDVILLDIALGADSGFEVSRRLVEAGHSGAKIVLISTHSGEDFEDLIAATPAVGFVPKSDLSASAIRRLVAAPEPSPEA